MPKTTKKAEREALHKARRKVRRKMRAHQLKKNGKPAKVKTHPHRRTAGIRQHQ